MSIEVSNTEEPEVLLTKKGKPRKRKPKTKNNYFTQETEDAIVAYNNSTSQAERNKLYNDTIHHAFFKLTENIIHTFKFYYTEVENLEDLQHEIITFLLEKTKDHGHSGKTFFEHLYNTMFILEKGKESK